MRMVFVSPVWNGVMLWKCGRRRHFQAHRACRRGPDARRCKAPQFTQATERQSLPPRHRQVIVVLMSPLQCVSARSEEHTSELQSLMRNSYAVFCLNKKTQQTQHYNSKKISYMTIF